MWRQLLNNDYGNVQTALNTIIATINFSKSNAIIATITVTASQIRTTSDIIGATIATILFKYLI